MRARLAICAFVAALAVTTQLHARTVDWKEVEVREGDDARRVQINLKSLLKQETRRAKWGDGKKIELRARVTELVWEKSSEDVLRLSVTVVARIAGGESARSRIRIGGHPRERKKLLQQALGIVASGLVTRLAAISRASNDKER